MTASGGERVALVEAVAPFLDDWQALLKDIRMLTPERANAMLDRAENLRHQADAAGQGSIVHQLEVCIGCLKAPALDRRGFQEALRSLSEVTWQLKQELGPLVRRGSGAAADAGPRSLAPPPLLSDQGAPVPSLVSRGGFEPPPPLSLPGVAPRFEPPPNLSSPNLPAAHSPPQNRAEPPRAASPAPVVERPAQPAPARPFEAAGPSIIPLAGNRAPQPSPQILGPRGNAPAPAPKGKDKPNLMVATMFGLRAFGRGKGGPSAPPAAAPGNSPQILGRGGSGGGGVLGLGRRQHNEPSGAPEWIGPRAGGLPELGSGGPPPAANGAAADIDQRLRQLRGQDEPRGERRPSSSSSSRSSRPPTVPPGGAARARSGSGSSKGSSPERKSRRSETPFPIPWWIGAVAVAVVGLVVVGLLVFGRTSPSASLAPPAASGDPGAGAELPTSRLLDDKERMRALISLVHSYGGAESPELADLVNEEAALVYEVLERSCDQPGDKCERPAPMIAGTVRTPASPQHEIHHLFEDRKLDGKTRASGQVPKWLAGLQMPAIGTADEPSVRRSVEYYTSNQSGREEFQNMLFRCGAYQDLIEKTLVHYGMPRALLALVMTESGCVPHAESPVGARGLWQFMPATARAYHLNVKEDVIDERISPPKSTEAAVKYLADLYRKMGSWEFALASYNMGPFGLSARIRRAGGDVTFWDLAAAGYLPDETAKYVPRIQAYALILENLGHFNFSTAQMRATEVTGELEAPPGTRLGMVARASSTSLDHLKLLNPDIVGTSVPDLPGTRFMVQVPKEDVLRAQSVLEQLLAAADQRDRCVPSAFDWGSERFTDAMCAPPGKPRKPR